MLGSRTRRSSIAASSATRGRVLVFSRQRSRKGHLYAAGEERVLCWRLGQNGRPRSTARRACARKRAGFGL